MEKLDQTNIHIEAGTQNVDLCGLKVNQFSSDRPTLNGIKFGLANSERMKKKAGIIVFFVIFTSFSTSYWASSVGSQIVFPLSLSYETTAVNSEVLWSFRSPAIVFLAIEVLYSFWVSFFVWRNGARSVTLQFLIQYSAIPIAGIAFLLAGFSGSNAAFLLTLTLLFINTVLLVTALTISFTTQYLLSRRFRKVSFVDIFVLLSSLAAQIFESVSSYYTYIDVVEDLVVADLAITLKDFFVVSLSTSFFNILLIVLFSRVLAKEAIGNKNKRHRATRSFCEYMASRKATKFMGNLKKVSFANADLGNTDFSEVKRFEKVDWSGAVIQFAHFNADIDQGLLKGVPTDSAEIVSLVTLRKGRRKGSDIADGVNHSFTNLNLSYASLNERDLSRISFIDSNLDYVSFCHTQFSGSHFKTVSAVNADFSGAEIKDSRLIGTELTAAKFDHAILTDSKFANVTANNAQFISATLCQSRFIDTSFVGSSFRKASLEGTQLEGVNLRGAILAEANLTGLRMDNVLMDGKTELVNCKCDFLFIRKERYPEKESEKLRKDQLFECVNNIRYLINLATTKEGISTISGTNRYFVADEFLPLALTGQLTKEALVKRMSDQPSLDFTNATFNAPVNIASNYGNQAQYQSIQNAEQHFDIYISDFKQFICELQEQYPDVSTPEKAAQIIEVKVSHLPQPRLQTFLNLKRLLNGAKNAGVKVAEHFVEENVWGKGAITFLEGISEET